MDPKKKWRPNQRFFTNVAVVVIGITYYVGLSHIDLVGGALEGFTKVLSPFIWAFVMAYLLDGPIRFFEKRFKMRRGFAIVLTYFLAVVLLAVLLSFVIPQLAQSIMKLAENIGGYMESLNHFVADVSAKFNLDQDVIESMMLSYTVIMQQASTLIKNLLPQILNYGMALGSGLVSALTALIASIYMLIGKERLLGQLHKIVYAFFPLPKAKRVLEVSGRANRIFTGFINGKIIDSAIIGLICFAVTTLFDFPFALLLSVIVGVTNVIPFFGPFIGAIPCVMLLLMINPLQALEFGIFIIILQQFDGNILGPKILGDSTGLSAIWVLVSIIVGGGLFGFAGMLVGVPAFAVLYFLTSDLLAARLKEKGIDPQGNPLPPPPPEEPSV